ncbi:long-chain-fatty-acid--CoA ligase [Candidatus Obscuribacterales bacterium]|nr:long-chain-fatty-acid--CoA ligase [Candidatus Obscuribacterales bacterium]MBX3153183.1 long-chain-fatty-acid--CoA ligase [Candidatus Obscuribacterales bacterium]
MNTVLSSETKIPTGWPSANIGDALSVQAARRPKAEAVVFGDKRIDFASLNARSLAMEEQIRALGLQKGDKVSVLFPNHPDFIAIFFAVAKIGAVVVPINPMLKSAEIAHILSDSNSRAIIVHNHLLPEVVAALPQIDGLQFLIVSERAAELQIQSANSELKLIDLTGELKPDALSSFDTSIDPEHDLALLVYTSGTTGKPKGAMLTHRSLMSVFPFNIFSSLDLKSDERILGLLPMCHIYGIGSLVSTPVALGCTVVIMPKFEAKAALDCIAKERITVVPGVPAMYQFMMMEYEQNKVDVSALRYCLSAAAPIAPEFLERIKREFNVQVVEGYGMSETAGGGTVNPPRAGKIGSIGLAIPEVSLAILDKDSIGPLPAGEQNVGEIAIKGPCVMLGYHNQPEASEEAFNQDGWLLTGDLGYQDEDGYVFIVGRKKEMIIRGGQNIYPRELEEVILKMDGVQDVAVIGVPDELMGERVKAFVVTRSGVSITEDAVKDFCSEHLAPYKVPRIVEFATELPRNSTGKLMKRMLK